MARTLITPKRVTSLAGLTWVAADLFTPDTANGNWSPNDGQTFLYLAADGTPRTCTVTTPVTTGGFAVADDPLVVPANAWGLFGPFPYAVFGPQLMLDFSNVALKGLVLSLLPEVRT